jgi:eukaryotic-like serine/threonine-protein kinase
MDTAKGRKKEETVNVDPRQPEMGLDRRLQVARLIDSGGMADIMETFDSNLLRTSALKRLRESLDEDPEVVGRLIEEAQITAQLDHPNVVPVHELGVDAAGKLYFTMKLVRGRNLRDILGAQDYRKRTSEDLFQHLQVFIKVCDAVAFAHSKGVIHRDLKPDNIMVGEYGEVYVMDWGIARLKGKMRPSARDREMPDPGRYRYEIATEEGMIIGTPGFLAPEQAMGDISAIDERSDVFSLGAILYQILTGAPPFFGRSARELVVNTVVGEIMPPGDRVDIDLPAGLCGITMKALAKDPAERFPGAADLKKAVESFLLSGWHLGSRVFQPGAVIVREGDPGSEAFVITEGRCQVYKVAEDREIVLREMAAGDVFGETAVLTGQPRTASVRAVDRVTVTVVSQDQLKSEMKAGAFLGRFVKTLAERFVEKDGKALDLEVELSSSELAISILKYMNFSGTTSGERREAKWSTICEVLSSYFRKPEKDVAAMVERLGTFVVDPLRDVISISRSGR